MSTPVIEIKDGRRVFEFILVDNSRVCLNAVYVNGKRIVPPYSPPDEIWDLADKMFGIERQK